MIRENRRKMLFGMRHNHCYTSPVYRKKVRAINTELAKDFIKYVATDDTFLERWAKDTGDLVSNNNVVNKIKDTYSEPFLKGQNHYAEFAAMANNVDGKLTQGTDQAIEGLWAESVTAYVNGEKTKDQAIADFKDQVSVTLGF